MDVDVRPLIPEPKLKSYDTLQMEQQQERENATMVTQPSTSISATSYPVVEHVVSLPLSPPPPSSLTVDMQDPSQSPMTPPIQRCLSTWTTLPPFSVATPPLIIGVSSSPPSSPSSPHSVILSLSLMTAMTSSPIRQTQTLTVTPEREVPPPASAEPPDHSSLSPDFAHYPPHLPDQSV
ncbi:hypothetical protein BDQ12DRAFT_729874, partial [Crucibulum laeve]